MSWIKEHSGNLFIALLSILGGGVSTFFFLTYQNRIRHLEYVTYKSESLLDKANDVGDSIKFTVNGKKVIDISELDVEIYNRTDKDFTDLPIVIEFIDQPNDWETISTNFLDQNKSKEMVEIKSFKSSSKNVRFGHIVKLLSRKEDDPVFYMKFLIKGNTIPKINVHAAEQAGVDFREIDKSKNQFFRTLSNYLAIIASLIGAILALVSGLLFQSNRRIKYYYDPETARYEKATPFYMKKNTKKD